MPVPTPHFLDHRTHRHRGSDSAASAPVVSAQTATAASLPTSTGATLLDAESDGIDQRSPVDQVRPRNRPGRLYCTHAVLQLQALNNQLQLENRIREGAENLLQMQLEVSPPQPQTCDKVFTDYLSRTYTRLISSRKWRRNWN